MNSRKLVFSAALLLNGVLAASSAHAGPHLQWQLTVETPVIRLPGHVVLPLPPIPVPRVVVTAPLGHGRGAYDGRIEPDPRSYRDRSRWDADGDGVPNRYDRVYNPHWDRDGDGVANRYDARPNDPRYARAPARHTDQRYGVDEWPSGARYTPEQRNWRDGNHGR